MLWRNLIEMNRQLKNLWKSMHHNVALYICGSLGQPASKPCGVCGPLTTHNWWPVELWIPAQKGKSRFKNSVFKILPHQWIHNYGPNLDLLLQNFLFLCFKIFVVIIIILYSLIWKIHYLLTKNIYIHYFRIIQSKT